MRRLISFVFAGDLINAISWISETVPEWLQLEKHDKGFLVKITRSVPFYDVYKRIASLAGSGPASQGTEEMQD